MTQLTAKLPDSRDNLIFAFHETSTRRLVTAAMRLFFNVWVDLRVTGVHHAPSSGACIVAANHVNEMDVFPIQLALPRPLFFMAKAELFENPFLDSILRQLGAFPVNRGANDAWALDHARKILDQGLVLAIFPEGRRSGRRGLGVAKTGAARLAIEKQVPILPVSVCCGQRFFDNFPRRTSVTITIADPIYPQGEDDALALTDKLMFTLSQNLPVEFRGVYSEIPSVFLPSWENANKD